MTSFRPARADDRRFIVSSWSLSSKESDRAGLIAMEDWERISHEQIGKVLDRPSTLTIVAFDEESDIIQGWISGDRNPGTGQFFGLPIVWYVYVKELYRRKYGICRRLFSAIDIDPEQPFAYGCRTTLVGVLQKKIPNARHDHLRARYPEGTR